MGIEENMEVEEQDSSETPAVAPEAASAEAAAPEEVSAGAAEEGKPAEIKEGEPSGEPVKFTPNTKYTFNQTEREVPKEFHSLMKDAESETKIRELFQRADATENYRQKLAQTREESAGISQENQGFKSQMGQLQKTYQAALQSGNLHKLDDVFRTLNIPEDILIKYAVAKVQLQEMPAEQRQAIAAQLDADRRAESNAMQTQQFQQQLYQNQVETTKLMLESTLARDDIKQAASSFDDRLGQAGAFKAEVIRQGKLAFYESEGKVLLTPDQAAQKVIEQYGLQAGAGKTAGQTPGSQVAASGKKVVQRTTQTIPNVTSRNSTSPLTSKPKSIEDLKKLYKQASQE